MVGRRFTQAFGASLMGGASFLALAGSASAQTVLFSSNDAIRKGPLEAGREQVVTSGTVQVKLASGAVASFVNSAQFSVREDGGIDLRSGSVTVVGTGGAVAVHMPEGVKGTLQGAGTASFSVGATGSRGSTTAGNVAITANGVTNVYAAGQFWSAAAGKAPDRVVAGVAAAVPEAGSVLPMREGGPVAVAANGLPIALGEALAGAGASGDLIAAARRVEAYDANPAVGAFPSGDYAALIGYAAAATSPLGAGGRAFNGAQADIIRTYFEYLAAGNAGANFRTAYAAVLVNYLDLVRSGVLPSSFRGATQAQLNAYIAFIGRTDGFGGLTPANRQLLDAYLAFLSANGTPDQFGPRLTSLTAAFLDYVRGGGDPAAFTQASASVVAQYLAIVNSGGLKTNLNAQNQALLAAYLANNGVAFGTTYATGLAQFVAYLNTGGLPSNYTAVPAATLRSYLETLESTGLFDRLLGAQAAFLRSYLGFLRTGGTPDQFNALPINVARVNAAALSAYVDYLLAGGAPTAYSDLTQAQIRAALDQLTAVGQFNALLGVNAGFLGEYYAYIATGADPDAFAGLPTVDVNAYAAVLSTFAAYLRAGNLPSNYATLTAQQVRSYLTALQFSGNITLLGGNATLLGDYLAYLRSGGMPDNFTGLPIYTYQGYASALAAYFAYLNAGGLPSGYAVLTQAQLRDYLAALQANGQFTLLGANSGFYTDYLAYLTGGGTVDGFNGLPIVTYQGYASALAAYFAYLNAGGLPSGYSQLSQAQIRAYLDALSANTTLSALLGANAQFFAAYRTYLAGGGTVDAYSGLPIVTYQGYASALAAYFAFLQGGGTPSAYTVLTQAQIRAYLDALSANSTLTALLGANATFFQAYYAYLAGGGGADAYAGLPSATYGQYAAALNAYFAYLTAGNLPSGYTVLTAQQIQQYLNVLQANGQLAALLGANATFYGNYLAFITGGGSPDAFTGLPIVTYQGYAAALSAYYAYLASGGLPANYSVLTQAQIRAYLDALNVAGQITALLGANATFFNNYLAYVVGGGNPDQFAGLPANQPPGAPVTTPNLAAAPVNQVATAASGKNLFSAASIGRTVTLDNGNVVQVGGTRAVTNQTAQTVETQMVDNAVAIARWTNGQFNTDSANNQLDAQQGVHLVWGAPTTSMPGSGSATYGLVAATSPTRDGGGVAPGTFTGNFGVNFTTRRVGWDSVISLGGVNYRFASDGGVSMPTVAIQGTTFNGVASTDSNGLAGSGSGFFSGVNAGLIGFAYLAQGPGVNGEIEGTAIFGRGASPVTLPTVTYPPSVTANLPAPTYSYTSGLSPSGVNIRTVYPNNATPVSTGTDQRIAFNISQQPSGALQAVIGSNQITRDTAKTTDVWGDNRVQIGRWYDGTYTRGASNLLSASQGLHYVVLAPSTFSLPTSGQVDYTLFAATQPTFATGLTGAGLFDGRMALVFGQSTTKVALEGTIQMPEYNGTVTYSFATPGGIAGVNALTSQSISNNNISVTAQLTGTGLACTTQCVLNFSGGFAGSNVNRIGATYYTSDVRGNSGPQIQGAAIFAGNAAVLGEPVITAMPAQPSYGYLGHNPSGRGFIMGNTDASPARTFNASTGSNNISATDGATPGSITQLQESSIGIYRRDTAAQYDVGGDDGVTIGRWSNGTISFGGSISNLNTFNLGENDGLHYMLLGPAASARVLPTSGTILYNLIAATQPTLYGAGNATVAAVAPGVLDARIAIAFGPTSRIGIEGAIYMPETGAGANKYSFASSGGIATPNATVGAGGFGFTAPMTGGGLACPQGAGTCQVNISGGFGGDGISRIGVTYSTTNNFNANSIAGTAAFAAAGTESQALLTSQMTQVFANGSRVDRGTYTAMWNANSLASYVSGGGNTVQAGTVQESGRLADTIGWARWTGTNAGPVINQSANAGAHVLSGTQAPNTNMPASGTATYSLVGSTNTTLADGSAAPGTITGSLAVAFAAVTSRVGFDITATVGGYGWRMLSNNGTANPSIAISNTDKTFVASMTKSANAQGQLTGLNAQSCVGTCSVDIYGGLYGEAASHVGLGFGISDGTARANGVAVFAKNP